ncbi:MAG: nuclear transport factor 2 family protein [Bacteroidetes bacterium]|nr:nuclear transport factor 2 family protein [Bacteroidota bacterium]
MKQVYIFYVCIAMFCCTGPRSTDQEKIVFDFKERFEKAFKTKNRKALEDMIHPSYVLVTPWGNKVTRDGMISADFNQDEPKFEHYEYKIEQVLADGNIVTANGYFKDKGTLHGRDITGSFRFSEVYIADGGTMKLIFTQLTEIKVPDEKN